MLKIENYNDFMLLEKNINKNMCNFLNNSVKNYNKKDYNFKCNNNLINKEYYIPYSKDKMFWCLYKIIDPLWDENENFKLEKDFKINCIEKFRKNKNIIKPYKITLSYVENDLLNEKTISLKTLISLCVLFKINLMYVFNKKFFEINTNSSEEIKDTFLIIKKDEKDSLFLGNKDLDYYRNNYFSIENINKPFKSISSYGVKDLELIAKKLDIDITNVKLKKDLYQLISEKF